MTWAANHDGSIDKMQQVQGSLTVGLIMVARDDFLTCSPRDTATQVKQRNADNFSFIPVVDEQEQVIGLYNAERWFDAPAPETLVADDFQRLSEEIVIGADASIFEFILQADKHPTNLVVSGNRIAGLVSLSDIQQLPVRAALFALITSLEMAMALAVVEKWPNPLDWIHLLSEGRVTKLKDEIAGARQRDGFVSEIAFTQFADKATLVAKGRILERSRRSLEAEFKKICELRNNLAHANSYADTPEAAKGVCETVRLIYQLKDEFMRTFGKATPED